MITNYENGEGELTIDKSELWPMRNEKKKWKWMLWNNYDKKNDLNTD